MGRLVLIAACSTAWQAIAGAQGYSVTVDGNPVEVVEIASPVHWNQSLPRDAAQPYAYAQFDVDGEAVVRVEREGSAPAEWRMRPCEQRVWEPDGRHRSLVIAANPAERGAPDRNDPCVVWVGPGRHRRNLRIGSNQTLYLAQGAVVEGCLRAEGTNMTICGRGRIDGACWGHYEGPGRMAILSGSDIKVRDISFSSAWNWCLVLDRCTNAVVENVKILGGHVLNDDGMDVCRSRNVAIRDSFIRCQDDCIAVKWNAENVLAERCRLWTDLANAFRIGFECDGKPFRHFVFRDIDILRMTMVAKNCTTNFWANCAICVQPSNESAFSDILFEDIRFHEAATNQILLLAKTMPIPRTRPPQMTAGSLDGLTLRNVSLPPNSMPVRLEAADAEHPVRNVVFENVSPHGPHEYAGCGVPMD